MVYYSMKKGFLFSIFILFLFLVVSFVGAEGAIVWKTLIGAGATQVYCDNSFCYAGYTDGLLSKIWKINGTVVWGRDAQVVNPSPDWKFEGIYCDDTFCYGAHSCNGPSCYSLKDYTGYISKIWKENGTVLWGWVAGTQKVRPSTTTRIASIYCDDTFCYNGHENDGTVSKIKKSDGTIIWGIGAKIVKPKPYTTISEIFCDDLFCYLTSMYDIVKIKKDDGTIIWGGSGKSVCPTSRKFNGVYCDDTFCYGAHGDGFISKVKKSDGKIVWGQTYMGTAIGTIVRPYILSPFSPDVRGISCDSSFCYGFDENGNFSKIGKDNGAIIWGDGKSVQPGAKERSGSAIFCDDFFCYGATNNYLYKIWKNDSPIDLGGMASELKGDVDSDGDCSLKSLDCDDFDKWIYPGNPNKMCDCDKSDGYDVGKTELCNNIDDDCDGVLDDTTTIQCNIGTGWAYLPGCYEGITQTCANLGPVVNCYFGGRCKDGTFTHPTSPYCWSPLPFSLCFDFCKSQSSNNAYPFKYQMESKEYAASCWWGGIKGIKITSPPSDSEPIKSPSKEIPYVSAICPSSESPSSSESSLSSVSVISPPAPVCQDSDGDTYGENCAAGADCNDANSNIKPSANDNNCNGVDDNCNGQPDEGYQTLEVACGKGICQNKGELKCVAGSETNTCDALAGAVSETCDDETGYDGLDNNCDGAIDLDCNSYCDQDGDGYTPRVFCIKGYLPGDCDDTNVLINPSVKEIYQDGIDNNCNGDDDEGTDADEDLYKVEGGSLGLVDCNDNDGKISPSADDDNCDGIDDNCNGQADENYQATSVTCGKGICQSTGEMICSNGQEITTCNALEGAIPESCDEKTGYDGIDNNCDGTVDLDCNSYCDEDRDKYTPFVKCSVFYTLGDCNDTTALINEGQEEIYYDGVDNDCNSETKDEGTDADGDLYKIEGGLCGPIDCNDSNPNVNPSLLDDCDGIDNNCNGKIDEDYNQVQTNCGEGSCKSIGMMICIDGMKIDTCNPFCGQVGIVNLEDEMDVSKQEECEGCFHQGGCVPAGIRTVDESKKIVYCDGAEFREVKILNENCLNNYECQSSKCLEGFCVSKEEGVCNTCVECGAGLFSTCNEEECKKCGACEFEDGKCFVPFKSKLNAETEGSEDNDNDTIVDSKDCDDYNSSIGECKGCAVCSEDASKLSGGKCIAGICQKVKCPPYGECGAGDCGEDELGIFPEFADGVCKVAGNLGTCDDGLCSPAQCSKNPSCLLDKDKDGIPDGQDRCIRSGFSGNNNLGCPLPRNTLNLRMSSLENEQLEKVGNFTIETDFAKIEFKEEVSLMNEATYEPVNLEGVKISPLKVEIDETLRGLNKPAVITMENVHLTTPYVTLNGERCEECKILSYKNNVLVFEVPHFSIYEIKGCGDLSCDSESENCDNCEIDCGECETSSGSSSDEDFEDSSSSDESSNDGYVIPEEESSGEVVEEEKELSEVKAVAKKAQQGEKIVMGIIFALVLIGVILILAILVKFAGRKSTNLSKSVSEYK